MRMVNVINRRRFLGTAAGALAASGSRVSAQEGGQRSSADVAAAAQGHPLVVPGYFGSRPGIQLGTQLPSTAGEDEMRFARQRGVEWVMTSLPPKQSTLENYLALKRKFAAHELKIYRWANHSCHNTEEELWDNYIYFVRKVVPVAQEAGVYIGIHPDDPTV